MYSVIKSIFNEINVDMFNSTLDMPTFVFLSDGEHYGWLWEDDTNIFININPFYCEDYLTIFGTVAHEMCHYADWLFYKKEWDHLTHDGKFARMALEIETFYNLNRGDV